VVLRAELNTVPLDDKVAPDKVTGHPPSSPPRRRPPTALEPRGFFSVTGKGGRAVGSMTGVPRIPSPFC
jgi:hypothetical protein